MELIGDRVRIALEQSGRTVTDLAESTGLTRQGIHSVISGRVREPTTGVVTKIATELGVSVDWLITGNKASPPPSQAARPDRVKLLTAIQVVEEVLASMGITYPPKQRADLIMGCYLALEAGQQAAAAKAIVAALLEAQRIKT